MRRALRVDGQLSTRRDLDRIRRIGRLERSEMRVVTRARLVMRRRLYPHDWSVNEKTHVRKDRVNLNQFASERLDDCDTSRRIDADSR